MKLLKKIWDKYILEIKCYRADHSAFRSTCFEMYPPSFYIRYSPEEQKAIRERDMKAIRELIDAMCKCYHRNVEKFRNGNVGI